MRSVTNPTFRRAVAAVAVGLTFGIAHAEPGALGISISVSTSGILSPNIEQAKITSVKPNSPAEAAGLRVNDLITRVEDCKIPGCSGTTATKLMGKEAGQTLRLTIQREGQPEREVVVTMGKKGT